MFAALFGIDSVCPGTSDALADSPLASAIRYHRFASPNAAAAIAAQADLIGCGDRKHRLPLGSHQGIAIVEAAEALGRMGSA